MSDNKLAEAVRNFISKLTVTPRHTALLKEQLGEQGFALNRIAAPEFFPSVTDPVRLQSARVAVIADTEATTPEPDTAEPLELGMIKVLYDEQGILAIKDTFLQRQQPSKPIEPVITKLTGITNEMVAGQRIDQSAAKAFLSDADRVIFHNASYDRRLIERTLPAIGLQSKSVDCTLEQIDWAGHGYGSAKQELIAARHGISFAAHSAIGDITALAFILNEQSSEGGTYWREMIGNSPKDVLQIIFNPPFQNPATGEPNNVVLKAPEDAGGFACRFSPDGKESLNKLKHWWRMLPDDPQTVSGFLDRLKAEVYGGNDFNVWVARFDPTQRYSNRPGSVREQFSREIRSAYDLVLCKGMDTDRQLATPVGDEPQMSLL